MTQSVAYSQILRRVLQPVDAREKASNLAKFENATSEYESSLSRTQHRK